MTILIKGFQNAFKIHLSLHNLNVGEFFNIFFFFKLLKYLLTIFVYVQFLFIDIEKPEKPEISYFNMNSGDRLAHDYWLYFQTSTTRESYIDNNNPLKDESNKGTREKQLARTLQTQLPAPARSGKNSKNLPIVPDTIIHELQPTDDGYTGKIYG